MQGSSQIKPDEKYNKNTIKSCPIALRGHHLPLSDLRPQKRAFVFRKAGKCRIRMYAFRQSHSATMRHKTMKIEIQYASIYAI